MKEKSSIPAERDIRYLSVVVGQSTQLLTNITPRCCEAVYRKHPPANYVSEAELR